MGTGRRTALQVLRTTGQPRIVEEEGFDLTAVGAGSTRWLGRLLLGSVSMRVLHASPTSVLVAHDAPGSRVPAPVFAGVDGSDDATFAVETLVAFADPARTSVKVLCIEEVPTAASTLRPPFGGSAAPTPDLLRKLKDVTWGVAEHAAERLEAAGFRVEPAVVPGAPAACLLEEAESDEADLVVVGSRGLGPLSRILVGSVSDRIARNARAALICRRLP